MADTDEMIKIEIVMERSGKMNTALLAHPSIERTIAQTLAVGLMCRAVSLYGQEQLNAESGDSNG